MCDSIRGEGDDIHTKKQEAEDIMHHIIGISILHALRLLKVMEWKWWWEPLREIWRNHRALW